MNCSRQSIITGLVVQADQLDLRKPESWHDQHDNSRLIPCWIRKPRKFRLVNLYPIVGLLYLLSV